MRLRAAGSAVMAATAILAHPWQQPIVQTTSTRLPFHWEQCTADDPHYQCGWIELPLDYTNASDPRTVTIATTMYQPRPGQKSARTLIVEPGGPGASGTEYIWRKGRTLADWYTDDQLDVLGFDPRGVNLSSPAMSCFPKNVYRDRWSWTEYSWPEVRGYASLEQADAMAEATMKGCRAVLGDLPRFMSTAFVVRDIDAIREALGEDTLTGYMVSYGTGIGQTYTQMFPKRVGRLVLDGVEYAKDSRRPEDWLLGSLDNATDAFETGFVGECVTAGPGRCALAGNATRNEVSARLHKLFASVAQRPVPGFSTYGPGIVTYETLTSVLFRALYKPSLWKAVAQNLADLERGNATGFLEAFGETQPDYNVTHIPRPIPHQDRYTPYGSDSAELQSLVVCGDSWDAEKHDLTWWKDLHARAQAKSWIVGTPFTHFVLPCRHFDWKVAEVHRGDFNHKLANPILIVTTPFDPVTPIANARKLADEMGNNARTLISLGYGHSSGNDESDCAKRTIKAYILEGEVPDRSVSICEANKKPFDEAYGL